MSFLMSGDDALIKRLIGFIFVLVFLLAVCILVFGILQFAPADNHDLTCTIRMHPVLSNRYFQIDEPLIPRHCHG